MTFSEKIHIAGCIIGYHTCMLNIDDSVLWAIPAVFFIVFGLSSFDKVKK